MKNKFALMQMMATAMAAASTGLYDSPTIVVDRPKPAEHKNNVRKCKSCKHFHKFTGCTIRPYSDPMRPACDQYQKRKR